MFHLCGYLIFLYTILSGGSQPWLLVYLHQKDFQVACENFGRAHYIGRHMPPEIPKSWTYLQEAFNTCARTPITAAVEAAITGVNTKTSAVFYLFGSSLKTPKNKKKKKRKKGSAPPSIQLTLPLSFESEVHKVAPLVKHFMRHLKDPSLLYGVIEHKPSDRERAHLIRLLSKLVADPITKGLSAKGIFHQHVEKRDFFADYTGPDWDAWFIHELERIKFQPTASLLPVSKPKPNPTGTSIAVHQYLIQKGVTDNGLICFVSDLCRLTGPATRPFDIVEQWHKVLTACSSHWCRPTLCWCVGSTLVMFHVDAVTRVSEGGVIAPATHIENWDMLAITRLLQCSIFSEQVRQAAQNVNAYTRRDIAHERFDCDWKHSCQCLVELLQALNCPSDAAKMKVYSDSKAYSANGGNTRFLK